MNAMQAQPAPDHGSTGPAQRARIVRPYPVATPGEVVVVTRYSDATLHDRMHQRGQLGDRQHQAACRIAYLWHAAGLDAEVTQDYGCVGDHVDSDQPDAHDVPTDADEQPIDRYRAAMRSVSRAHGERIEGMLCGQHPGVSHLATLQAALDAMAVVLGIEWQGVGR